MENKTIIEKVKLLLSEEVVVEETVVEAKFLTVTTQDGQAIEIEGEVLEVGAVVVGVTEETSYILEDGTELKVSAEGVIAEIVEPTVEEEEVVEEEMAVVNPNDARIEALEGTLAEILSKFSSIKESIDLISNEPAEEEIKIDKKEFKAIEKTDILKSIASYKRKNLQK